MKATFLIRTGVSAALLTLAACGGGGGEEPPAPVGLQPTLASIQANIFTPTCVESGCHATPGMNGLNLDNVGISSSNLINVPASYGNGLVRVVPGDSDNSFLIQKLEGTTMFGGRMPLNRTPLQQVTVDVIRQWIDSCVGNTCP